MKKDDTNRKKALDKISSLLVGYGKWCVENSKTEVRHDKDSVYHSELMKKVEEVIDECGYKQRHDDATAEMRKLLK